MPKKITAKIIEKTSQKTGKDYKALLVEIGEYETLVFPQSKFDLKYLEHYLSDDESDLFNE